jgi:hypothetical protein
VTPALASPPSSVSPDPDTQGPRTVVALFEATLGLRIRNSSYRAALAGADEEISHQTATSDLGKMVDVGLLVKHGARRGTRYAAGAPMIEIRRTHLAGRQTIDLSTLFGEPAIEQGDGS